MLPKVESIDDVLQAVHALERAGAAHLPLHALIESLVRFTMPLTLLPTRACRV